VSTFLSQSVLGPYMWSLTSSWPWEQSRCCRRLCVDARWSQGRVPDGIVLSPNPGPDMGVGRIHSVPRPDQQVRDSTLVPGLPTGSRGVDDCPRPRGYFAEPSEWEALKPSTSDGSVETLWKPSTSGVESLWKPSISTRDLACEEGRWPIDDR